MNLYGNPPSDGDNPPIEVKGNSGSWYYGLEITNSTDIDSCSIILY